MRDMTGVRYEAEGANVGSVSLQGDADSVAPKPTFLNSHRCFFGSLRAEKTRMECRGFEELFASGKRGSCSQGSVPRAGDRERASRRDSTTSSSELIKLLMRLLRYRWMPLWPEVSPSVASSQKTPNQSKRSRDLSGSGHNRDFHFGRSYGLIREDEEVMVMVTTATLLVALWSVARGLGLSATLETFCPG
jgi:hypothetical protein